MLRSSSVELGVEQQGAVHRADGPMCPYGMPIAAPQEQEAYRWDQQRQFAGEEAQRQAQLAQYQVCSSCPLEGV